MPRRLSDTYNFLLRYGVDIRRTKLMFAESGRIRSERQLFEQQRVSSLYAEAFPLGNNWPVAFEGEDGAGVTSGDYFHQDLQVARSIFERQPLRHIDVGSRIDGFVAHVASFREIDVIDFRPVESSVLGINFIQADLTLPPPVSLRSDSVSCLHALEHFGLGRYGDKIDFDGWKKGLENISRLVESGGTLYLSVPTGRVQRVEFNAHRIFSIPFLRSQLLEDFELENLDFVDDRGDLLQNVSPYGEDANHSFMASHGCSIWTLTKKSCN